MKIKNTVYSQLNEAIRFANYETFDYRRISLILFDNIIENLLSIQIYYSVRYERIFDRITKEEHQKIINGLNKFENITKYAKRFKIISEKQKPLLDFCHKARNNVYHKFYENEKIIETCVGILSEFLISNVKKLIQLDFDEYSDTLTKNQEKIFEIGNINSYEEVIENLKNMFGTMTKPSVLFSEIILDELTEIIEFQECCTNEDWGEFNNVVKKQYFWDVKYKNEVEKNKEIDLEILVSNYKQKWKDFNQIDFDSFNVKAKKLKEFSTDVAFEKFANLKDKISPYYFGMKYYISEQEYLADLNENK